MMIRKNYLKMVLKKCSRGSLEIDSLKAKVQLLQMSMQIMVFSIKSICFSIVSFFSSWKSCPDHYDDFMKVDL